MKLFLNFALKQKDEYCTGSCNFGVLSIMLNLLKQKMRSRSRAQKTLLRLQRHNSFNSGYDDQKHTFLPKIYPCGIISICTATSVLLFDSRMSIFFLCRITFAAFNKTAELTAIFALSLMRRCRACETDEVCRRRDIYFGQELPQSSGQPPQEGA